MITLPTTPLPVERKNPKVLLIYGPPKVGKTASIAALPDTLIVDIEDGTNHIAALKVKVRTLAELDKLIEQLLATTPRPYKRIAWDTLDELEDLLLDDLEQKNAKSLLAAKVESVLELPYGAGYEKLRTAFKNVWARMVRCSDETILVCHVRDRVLVDKQQREVVSNDLDLRGKVRKIACAYADAIGFCTRTSDGKLVLTFRNSSDATTCGNRSPHLSGKEFVLAERNADGSLKTHWENIYVA